MEAVSPGLHLLCDCTQTKGTRQVAVLAPATYDELSQKWQRDDTLSHQLPQKLEFRLVTKARVARVSAQQRVRLSVCARAARGARLLHRVTLSQRQAFSVILVGVILVGEQELARGDAEARIHLRRDDGLDLVQRLDVEDVNLA